MIKTLNNFNKLERYTKYSFYLIIIAFFIRLILTIISTPSGDACWHLAASRFIANNLTIPLFEPLGRDVFWSPPLFHILAATSYLIFNNLIGEVALKLIPPIFGTLFILYSFLLVRKLFNSKIAFYSTLFLTFIPAHLYISSISYVDVTMGFFAIASIYYALENRLMLSAAFTGLALLTKTNAYFIIPVIIYIILSRTKDKKTIIKRISFFILIAIAISAVWYVRNWVYLGNPIYPFMNNIIGGYQTCQTAYCATAPVDIDIPGKITNFYLSMFGVPNGNVNNSSVIGEPTVLLLWLAATLFFISFFFIGILQVKREFRFNVLNLTLLSFMIFQVVYNLHFNLFIVRLIIPALVLFSTYWALGLNKTISTFNFKKIIYITIILCICIFAAGEFIKSQTASNMWGIYEDDFNWIKENTEKDALFLVPGGQCYSYHFDRYTIGIESFEVENKTSFRDFVNNNISYVFYPEVETSFVISSFDIDITETLDKSTIVYHNSDTNIKLYKLERP